MCCTFLRASAWQRQGWALERMQRSALPGPMTKDPMVSESPRDVEWQRAKVEFDLAVTEYERLCASCCK